MCGARSPRLDPPHSRTALTLVLYILMFVGLRAPNDGYELGLMVGTQVGNKMDPYRGLDPRMGSPDTRIILDCLVYLPCLLHPLILIILNPDYRQGLRNVWRTLYCNKDSTSPDVPPPRADQGRRFQAPRPIIKQQGRRRGDNVLVQEVQPMIMPTQKPLMHQMGKKLNAPGYNVQHGAPYISQGTPYIPQGAPYIPMEAMPLHDTSFQGRRDDSFETEHSPQAVLPAQFNYGKFNYIDTARVEPKIAYTPTSTPPKTPQMPHFDKLPFKQPNYIDGTWILPDDLEAYKGRGILLMFRNVANSGHKT